jgi:cellulase/cellobiase CelA1/aryl-phospho-beta-D-glucosidase BglC (GH1 family)
MHRNLALPCWRVLTRQLTGCLPVLAVLLLTLVASCALAQTHVANPYVGASVYVNPGYTAEVQAAATQYPAYASQIATVGKTPTFVWLDRIAAVAGGSVDGGGLGLQGHINAAVAQANGNPIVVQLVIYDLPDRDCAALASGGELSIAGNDTPRGYTTPLTGTGIQEYENDYITPIYNILATAPSNVRFVLVVEDDSLPNIVTNTGYSYTLANCVAANAGQNYPTYSMQGVYVQGIQYALNKFHSLPNVYNYLDIAHHGWLGWTQGAALAFPFFADVVKGTTAGFASMDGIITNTANYGPTKEPYLTATETVGGNPVDSVTFYSYDPEIDEIDYVQEFATGLSGVGFSSSLPFLIDTSRNGWGGPTRPTGPGTSTDLTTFVNESKIDQRDSMGQWCNQPNQGIGAFPAVNPTAGIAAYVWVKPPGESDGNYPGSVYNGVTSTVGDPNCDPAHLNALANNEPTNAIPNSPPAGTFWITEFMEDVENANPPISTSATPTFTVGVSAGTLSVAAGSSATDSITITDENGFTGSVTLAATGLPSGVTAAFGTNPATATSTLTLTASSSAAAGTSTVTITGTSGSVTASTTIALTITGGSGGGPGNGILGAGVTPAVSVCAVNSTVPIPAYGYADYYTFQNNEWNSTLTQCASVSGFGFDLTTANFDQAALGAPAEYTPATYPSIFWGCHWGSCTTGSSLPIQESALSSSASSVSTVEPSGFTNDVSYDIWFNQTPTTTGQPNGTEIMIWINSAGGPSPFGTNVGTTTIDGTTWQVWTGRQTSWNIVSYVQVPGNTVASNLNLMPFYQYATTQSVNGSAVLEPSWYLIDIEFGFEVWDGGQGLALTGFSASASSTTTNPAPIISSVSPTSGAAGSSMTITGTNLGSSDTVSFGGSAATVTSSSATSLTVTVPSGLAAGSYSVTVTSSGGTSNAETFTVTGTSSPTVGAASGSATVMQSASVTDAITVSGFSGSATLTASSLPSGVTASFATNPTSSTSVLTLSASSTATTGAFTITITGTSGSQTASASVTLAVTASSCKTTSAGFTTSGNQIIDPSGNAFRIEGVNWYGEETSSYVFHGLYDQDYKVILNQIKSWGFNTVRIPFSQQVVETNPSVGSQINQSNGMNAGLGSDTSLQVMDAVIEYAGSIGLHVILDNHRSEAGNSNEADGLWYNTSAGYSSAQFVTDWQTMATRYSQPQFTIDGVPIIIGMDLRNEPHLISDSGSGNTAGSCWTGDTTVAGCPTSNTAQNWPVAAEAAGNAILAINPNFLIFVEGLDCYTTAASASLSPSYLNCDWQGGNLQGVANYPVVLNVPNRVVYSAHDYGPDCGFTQPWETSSTTLATLEQVWNTNWAYISTGNIAPVWVGEFGVDHTGDEVPSGNGSNGQWFTSLIQFLGANPKMNWSYWAFNGEDQMGLENSTYTGIETPDGQTILTDLTAIQTATSGGATPSFTLSASPTSLSVPQGKSGTVNLTVTDLNCFTGTVTFAASGLPSGVTASFSGNVLTLAASSTATVGASTVTITGTSGSLSETTNISLTITAVAGPSFTLSASPASVSVAPGSSVTSTITVTPLNGFTGAVSYTASTLPAGVTASFSGNVLTLAASTSAASGASTVTITGTSGSLSATAPITLTVTLTGQLDIDCGGAASGTWVADEDFDVGTASVHTNAVGTALLTGTIPPQAVLQSERYNTGTFTYTIPGLTAGGSYNVTLYFVESYVTGAGQREFNVLIGPTSSSLTQVLTNFDVYAAAGNAQWVAVEKTFPATASSSGQVVIQFTLGAVQNPLVNGIVIASAVTNPSFTLAASPVSLSLVQGASGASTITVTSVNGFTGTVTYAASGLPSGVTASFSGNVLTLAASSTATVGASTVTVTGTSGSLTATTKVALTVTAKPVPSFTLSASPASLSLVQGTSGTSTITVTPVNGFTGTVTYTTSTLPSGVTASFSGNVLTLTASSTATVGTSTVTITGTSGSLSATTTVALAVTQKPTGVACHAVYAISSQYSGGFGATITVTNTGTTSWTNPTLTFSFANGQVVQSGWGGTVTQSGPTVTIAGVNYGNPIAPGTSDSNIGFSASWNNVTNASPTSFAINGTTCN